MTALRLRRATADDIYQYYGLDAPGYWFGIVAEDDVMMLGIGGVFAGADGRHWAALGRQPGVRAAKSMLVACRAVMQTARELGIVVSATADDRVPGSVALLERLGFQPTAETIQGVTVWQNSP